MMMRSALYQTDKLSCRHAYKAYTSASNINNVCTNFTQDIYLLYSRYIHIIQQTIQTVLPRCDQYNIGQSLLQQLYGLHYEQVDRYEISISQMAMDLLHYMLIYSFLISPTFTALDAASNGASVLCETGTAYPSRTSGATSGFCGVLVVQPVFFVLCLVVNIGCV